MQPVTESKIILVTRRTRLDDLIARFNTLPQARFYVERLGGDFSDYFDEHARYGEALAETERVLREIGRLQVVDRGFLPNFIFGERDLVVVLGQDGLVANTLKYLTEQPLIGVNPDPKRWDGVLLPFGVGDLARIVPDALAGRRRIESVTMAEAKLNDGQTLYGVNDLFIGHKSHVSARYVIAVGDRQERHSSSGLIVSTGLGSTGWLRSVIVGATAIARAVTGADLADVPERRITWDADQLFFSVREPFPSKTSAASLVFGEISPQSPLTVRSLMPERGVIFSDGLENDFLEFNSGAQATISVAAKKGRLVV
jgi:hypothetical protein